ncbi:MAG: hypothetical protein JXQ30_13000 [Spirochaetes bacterium]|nr:hypothetical protein [Spirochaetota bacterium]
MENRRDVVISTSIEERAVGGGKIPERIRGQGKVLVSDTMHDSTPRIEESYGEIVRHIMLYRRFDSVFYNVIMLRYGIENLLIDE